MRMDPSMNMYTQNCNQEHDVASTSTDDTCSSKEYYDSPSGYGNTRTCRESCESGVESLKERLNEFDLKSDRKDNSKSTERAILRCSSISNDYVRLSEILTQIDGEDLKEILQRRLRKKDSKAVVALSLLLPRNKFPPINNVHCVRCHKNYHPRQHTQCVMRHPNSQVSKMSQDSQGANFHCRHCKQDFHLIKMFFYDEAVNSFMSGFCYHGNHTTNPLEVAYDGVVKTCEDHGCVEFYV